MYYIAVTHIMPHITYTLAHASLVTNETTILMMMMVWDQASGHALYAPKLVHIASTSPASSSFDICT